MKELKVKTVFLLIRESKKQVSDLHNSVGPVTSESLDKVQAFLLDLEKEVVPVLPKERSMGLNSIFGVLGFLLVLNMLLPELMPEAIRVVIQLLLK